MLAILQKGEGRTYHDIAKEHGVSSRFVRWVVAYIKKGLVGIKIKKPRGSKSRITDRDKEIILSALFNDPHIFGYLSVVLTDIGDIIAYRHGLHFCREVNPYRNQNKV